MPTAFQTATKARQQGAFFDTARGFSRPGTVDGVEVQYIPSRQRGSASMDALESTETTASITLSHTTNAGDTLTLTAATPGDYGTFIDEAANSYTITDILAETDAYYKVQVQRTTDVNAGRVRGRIHS